MEEDDLAKLLPKRLEPPRKESAEKEDDEPAEGPKGQDSGEGQPEAPGKEEDPVLV